MPRATDSSVRELVEVAEGTDLRLFIRLATTLTDQLKTADKAIVLSTADLVLIESLLAAHFLCLRDPRHQSESVAGASASYQGQTAMYLESTHYGQQAILLDQTGWLAKRNQESKSGSKSLATGCWLGVD